MMSNDIAKIRKITSIAMLVFVMLCLSSYMLMRHHEKGEFTARFREIAEASFQKDIAYRRWNASHGGVYVPVTEKTAPNQYLNVPERDITTPSGRRLTLMNPSYMTRQVFELVQENPNGPTGHITTLKPIRPGNEPKNWEKEALLSFENGAKEFMKLDTENGKRVFLYMRPMLTEKACLKCHSDQGYAEGDIRGGISITVPAEDSLSDFDKDMNMYGFAILLISLFGITGILLSQRHICMSLQIAEENRDGAILQEKRYRKLFDQSKAAMLLVDPESWKILDANSSASEFYGYSIEELTAMKINQINCADDTKIRELVSSILRGASGRFIAEHCTKNGRIRNVEVVSTPVESETGIILHSIIFDITDKIKAEEDSRENLLFAQSLVNNSTIPTFVVERSGCLIIWNHSIEKLTGVSASELIGTNDYSLAFRSERHNCLVDKLLEKSDCNPETILKDKGVYNINGSDHTLLSSAAPLFNSNGELVAALETVQDVTQIVDLGKQLYQAQKLESIGLLAGGVAHDFNNVLTVVSGYANMIKYSNPDDETSKFAEEILLSVDRGANMTRSLLAYSGRQQLVKRFGDINRILTDLKKTLSRLIRENIKIEVDTCIEPLNVFADYTQVEQVIINLVVNARDAIEGSGTITITTSKKASAEGENVKPSEYALVSVKDTGCGVSADILPHIFDPFYTTKERGKGTGLGLAIIKSIVEGHNGTIDVKSSHDSGTTFTISIPLAGSELISTNEVVHTPAELFGTGTILVAEDSEEISSVLEKTLTKYGYNVITASDGKKGYDIVMSDKERIDLIITDMIMPEMNGRELLEKLRANEVNTPAIVISGYLDELAQMSDFEKLDASFLLKPLKPVELLSLIKRRLKSPTESAP